LFNLFPCSGAPFLCYSRPEADEKWALAERVPMQAQQATASNDLWTGEYRAYDHPNGGGGDGVGSSSESELGDDSSSSETSDENDDQAAAAAQQGPVEDQEELRYDTDGSTHTLSAFTEYYGPEEGARLWEFAAIARPAATSGPFAPSSSSSSRDPMKEKHLHESGKTSSRRTHRNESRAGGGAMRSRPMEPPAWSRFVALQQRTTGNAPMDDRDPRIAAAFQSFLEAEAEANALKEKEQGRARVAALEQALETRRVKSPVNEFDEKLIAWKTCFTVLASSFA
jgi:hypothetical protein